MPALKNIVTLDLMQRVKKLFDQEIGSRGIAKELGISRDFVQKIYKALGIYNSGRGTPRRVYKQTERKCVGECKENKSIDQFRKRIGQYADGTERISYEPICLECTRFLDNKRLRARDKQLRKEDPHYALRKSISFSVWKWLKNNGTSKNGESCLKYLPYTMEELRAHLEALFEPWMTWQNYGVYNSDTWNDDDPLTWTWQLDHTKPQSDFYYITMDCQEFQDCWALSNLRPLNAKQNNADGVNRVRHGHP